jgi:hypothetical protein
MAVTIKKGYPFVLPPWKRVFNPATFVYSYIPFNWSQQPILSDPTLNLIDGNNWSEVPLYGGSLQPNFPLLYPRYWVDENGFISSMFTQLAAAGVYPFEPSGEAGFLFTDGLENNGTDIVLDDGGNPHHMPNTVNNRWQGGDALIINAVILGPADNPAEYQWYTNIAANFPNPPYVVQAPLMIAHDQNVVNSVASAFNRVLFMYFLQRADTPYGTDRLQEATDAVDAILQSAVAGIANAEYHRTQTLADSSTIAMARATSFFGL